MATYQIRRGKDIKIKGAAVKECLPLPLPRQIAISPLDFHGIKPKPLVGPNDYVKVGTPLFEDKHHPAIKFVSPVSGQVFDLKRGDKRLLLQFIISPDNKQEAVSSQSLTKEAIKDLTKERAVDLLLTSGLWPCLRQRPFSRVANFNDVPKSIFVRAMNTDPLAPDLDFILKEKEDLFQTGLEVLKKLTLGQVHLCFAQTAQAQVLRGARGVQLQEFSGPHPAGNIGTHIHYVDPIKKGDVVWFIEAQDVIRIAQTLLKGKYSPEVTVAVTGEGVAKPRYVKTVLGAPVSFLVGESSKETMRYISGSILSGKNVGGQGFLGYYHSQITVIPEVAKRRFLGWLTPGFGSYSFSKAFASSFLPSKESSLDTDKNGSDREIVLNNIYDDYVAIDVLTFFLLKAVMSGDIEEAEKLGILECEEEDFALCTFVCPSKKDIGEIIRRGLDVIEKEG